MRLVVRIWKETIDVVGKYPKLFLPFVILGGVELISLYLLYLAPQRPISSLLTPPIKAFWGEKFIHYPFNLFLLPRLFTHVRTLNSASVGVLTTGILISMFFYIKEGLGARFWASLFHSIKKFFPLLSIWLILFILSSLVSKLTSFSHFPKYSFLLPYFTFLVIVLLEIPFIYAMPAIVIGRVSFFLAIKESFSLCKKFFFPTAGLVIIPSLLYLPVIVLRINSFFLMKKFFPEIILIVLGTDIFLSIVIDFLIVASTTILYLNQKS